jgi:hypothetical protein
MKLILTALSLAVVFAATGMAQNKSVYTSTRTSACRTIESTSEGAGSYVGECRGVGGYKLQVLEGDIRQSINIITPAKKKFELDLWNYYGGFSSVGEKVEWRTKRGTPVALIARFTVANPGDSTKTTSYLMIAKIGKALACVTDIVEPRAQQNEEARKLADVAAAKSCKQPGH